MKVSDKENYFKRCIDEIDAELQRLTFIRWTLLAEKNKLEQEYSDFVMENMEKLDGQG